LIPSLGKEKGITSKRKASHQRERHHINKVKGITSKKRKASHQDTPWLKERHHIQACLGRRASVTLQRLGQASVGKDKA